MTQVSLLRGEVRAGLSIRLTEPLGTRFTRGFVEYSDLTTERRFTAGPEKER
jgi:hypothetical protein